MKGLADGERNRGLEGVEERNSSSTRNSRVQISSLEGRIAALEALLIENVKVNRKSERSSTVLISDSHSNLKVTDEASQIVSAIEGLKESEREIQAQHTTLGVQICSLEGRIAALEALLRVDVNWTSKSSSTVMKSESYITLKVKDLVCIYSIFNPLFLLLFLKSYYFKEC